VKEPRVSLVSPTDGSVHRVAETLEVNRTKGYATALISFGVKGLCSIVITYLLANYLMAGEFAIWATLFSFGAILGVAELGVSQLILTTLHERNIDDIDIERLVSNSIVAMVVLSIMLLLITSVVFSWQHVLQVRWRTLLLATILLRIIANPYGAYLSALERYHERKLAEAISYAAAAVFIWWGVIFHADLSTLLLGMNIIITLGAVPVVARAVALGMPRVNFKAVAPADLRRLFATSFPYFVSNVSGLATYGGFIAMSALILNPMEVARLALLHNIVLMHAYQVFDLIFRQVQPRLRDQQFMVRLTALVAICYCVCLTAASLFGPWLFARSFPNYRYTVAELATYTTFVFLEICYLLHSSALQMKSQMKKRLQWLSIGKTVAFAGVVTIASSITVDPSLLLYSGWLVAFAASMAYLGWRTVHYA
jgi:hypothetical protein